LEIYFGSIEAAAAAAESLYKMREGIEVDYGQQIPAVETSTSGEFNSFFSP